MTKYKCKNCKGTYDDYFFDARKATKYEFYHSCPVKRVKGKVIEDPNRRDENVCTCGSIQRYLGPPDTPEHKELVYHRGSAVDTPLPIHKNNEKHWDLFPDGNGYSHIWANGKGRTRL